MATKPSIGKIVNYIVIGAFLVLALGTIGFRVYVNKFSKTGPPVVQEPQYNDEVFEEEEISITDEFDKELAKEARNDSEDDEDASEVVNVHFSKIFKKPNEKTKGEKGNEIDVFAKPKSSKKTESSTQKASYKPPKPKKIETAQVKEKPEVVEDKEKKPEITPSRYSHKNQQSSKNNFANSDGYIDAYLERDMNLSNGSEAIFILDEGCIIDGVEFKPMSVLYSQASFDDDRVNFTVRKILNTDNKEYQVYLIGYNDNYFKGIPYENTVNRAEKEGKEDVIDELVEDIPYEKSARILGKTFQNLRKDQDELHVYKGLKMKFKTDKL